MTGAGKRMEGTQKKGYTIIQNAYFVYVSTGDRADGAGIRGSSLQRSDRLATSKSTNTYVFALFG